MCSVYSLNRVIMTTNRITLINFNYYLKAPLILSTAENKLVEAPPVSSKQNYHKTNVYHQRHLLTRVRKMQKRFHVCTFEKMFNDIFYRERNRNRVFNIIFTIFVIRLAIKNISHAIILKVTSCLESS